MGIFNNVMSSAISSGTVRTNNDATWNRKIDSNRVDRRKEMQAKARTNFAKAVDADYANDKKGLDLLF